MTAAVTLPARGPSIAELHGYFDQARRAFDVAPVGYAREPRQQLHGRCALFANRLRRAPAGKVAEILLKLEAADWLEVDPKEALVLIRADLQRVKAAE
jgi:hypothetical protein